MRGCKPWQALEVGRYVGKDEKIYWHRKWGRMTYYSRTKESPQRAQLL